MKRTAQKLLALALSLALLLAAAPAARADGPVTSVTLSSSSLSLASGNTGQLTATVLPADATNRTLVWTSSNAAVARVSASGLVTALNAGTATITATAADGSRQSASCTVTVSGLALARSLSGGRFSFAGLLNGGYTAFSDTGASFTYISAISVPTAQGTLYEGYVSEAEPGEGVSSARRYYPGSSGTRLFKNITFVPKPGYSGTATVSFTCYYGDNLPYAGTLSIPVSASASGLAYTSEDGAPVRFEAEDFAAYAQNLGYNALRAVKFTLPAATYGTLYYNYTDADVNEGKVAADTLYYRSSAPALDRVWFVPRAGYTGSVTVHFTGYDNTGASFPGSANITVTGLSTGSTAVTDVSYTVAAGGQVWFDIADFERACSSALGTALNYIYFDSVPSSSARGRLYVNNGTASGGSSYRYYRAASGSRNTIGELNFRANSGTNAPGAFSLSYTGVDTSGADFRGSVRVYVTSGDGAALRYSTTAGQRVYLSATDFSNASYDATGSQLNYIRFTSLPSAARGTLYWNETTAAATDYTYYRAASGSSRLIDDLSFLPAAAFTSGSVTFAYTGYGTSGRSFTGTVTIAVAAAQTPSPGNTSAGAGGGMIAYASDGLPVSFRPADFTADAAQHLSYPLSTLKFYTPDAAAGRLCLDYVSPTSYTILDGEAEYLPNAVSRVSFLPHAGFEGAAYVRFLGTDATGKRYTGTLAVNVTPPSASSWFRDMSGHAWAVPAVDFLYAYGVVRGTDYAGSYSPASLMRRGDFVLMLSRAFGFGSYGTASFDDVPEDGYYAAAIAAARALGIVDGEAGTIEIVDEDGEAVTVDAVVFRPQEGVTRQDAALWLYRAMRRSGAMPEGTAADLAAYADAAEIAPYARSALATLSRLGVFEGDGAFLHPAAVLTRAEMAKILYYAIT